MRMNVIWSGSPPMPVFVPAAEDAGELPTWVAVPLLILMFAMLCFAVSLFFR